MPKYLIARTFPGVHNLSSEEMAGVSAKSNGALAQMGKGIQWDHSYVTEDTFNCVYTADNEGLVREHARIGGFPIDTVSEVVAVLDPVSGGA